MKRFTGILLFCTAIATAAPTIVDTVVVPVRNLRLTGVNGTTRTWAGRLVYDLRTGDNDSIRTDVAIEAVGAGAPVDMLQTSGDTGTSVILTGASGRREIFFSCRITGTPAAQYRARVTVRADRSAVERRADSILALMTVQEKVDQLHGSDQYGTPENTRLRIPGLLMCDGPIGYGCATATLFPAGIGQGCSWDTALVRRIGAAVGEEFRAGGKYVALGPMVNLVRNTQGGRNFESYGEDPYLNGKLAAADIRGLQSVGTIATVKHLICNDRENNRTTYSSDVNERTLREIYALPFEIAVKEGGSWSIMSAYNRINSVYASENRHILTDILKGEWGFRGFEMSDWDGTHSTVASANAGHDVEMPGSVYFGSALVTAVNGGQVSTATLDDKVRRVLRVKIRAGVLDSAVARYQSKLNGPEHQALALQAGRESLVLVKNNGGLLPLSATSGTVAVVGLFADSARLGGGGSSMVHPPYAVSLRQGLVAKIGASRVTTDYAHADVAVVVIGPADDHEFSDRCTNTLSGSTCASIYTWFGDQNAYVNTVMAANPRTVVVYLGGNPVVAESWTDAPAILVALYPGQEQGTAVAEALLGELNPGGKLCVSWPAASNQFVNWDEINNDGIGPHILYEQASEGPGYRFLDRRGLTPLWPFGYGLSYTTYDYSNLRVSPSPAYAGDRVTVRADVRNSGSRAGDEVAQLYVSQTGAAHRCVKDLKGFSRISLNAGETKTVTFELTRRDFAWYDSTAADWRVDAADFRIMVGRSSADLPLQATLRMNAE